MALLVTIFLFNEKDNTSDINLIKNPVLHLKTEYIEVRHYFIGDHV